MIYPNELEVKDTTNTQESAFYLDLHLEINNGGILKTKLYDKRDDFAFPIVNCPFISSNIPAGTSVWLLEELIVRNGQQFVMTTVRLYSEDFNLGAT
jgi:hypothetical protein